VCILLCCHFKCFFFSQERGRLGTALHAELLNEFFLMNAGGRMRLPLTPILSYWSVIVPRARQLLPLAPKWKGSSACFLRRISTEAKYSNHKTCKQR